MAQDAQLPATPKERKAMRRAVPSAAVARAKSASGSPRVVNDGMVSLASGSPMATADRSAVTGPEALCEALHGMRHYVVRRHKLGAFSLHRDYDGQFLLAARAEGGGISSFVRIYSDQSALTGMTPGKDADCYLGKVESDGLYMRRGSKKAPKLCAMELRYGKKNLPDGTRQLTMLLPSRAAAEPLMPLSPSTMVDPRRLQPAGSERVDPGDRRGWLQFSAIPPLFSAEPVGAAAGDRARSGGGGSSVDGGGGEAALMASLSSPVPDSVAGEAAGGWVGTGAGALSKGEADCVLRLGKTANDEFTLLCGPPLSPLQGFAVACSSLSK